MFYLKKFFQDENGQGMVEYILIVALIAIVTIATVKMFGGQIKVLFKKSAEKLQSEGDRAISSSSSID